ncbi:MAG: septal ring lytic transglycosylase RlpA family protein [Caldisericaceae bacterium]|nr:septal ring lytic transglycosylase RlpA family protein [Caldisericaceae bacterium]
MKKKINTFFSCIFFSKQIFIILIFSTLLTTSYCSSTVRFSSNSDSLPAKKGKQNFYVGQVLKGKCSFYASKFHGRKTASGEIYNMFDLTAAHRTLPFGTILEIENLSNGKKVKVRVNDRGPFKANRILDLSLQAARQLDFIEQGTTTVKATIIELGKE